LEANLDQFKIEQAAINSEAAKQWALLQATIEKNKSLYLRKPWTKGDFTGPILAVKEDLGQKLIDDLDEPLMVLESDGMINKNEFTVVAPVVVVAPIVVAPIAVAPFVVTPIAVAPVAPVVVAPDEPSFVPLGRKIKQNQAEQKLGCEICLQELVPTERRTWDPGIDVMEQHLEDKIIRMRLSTLKAKKSEAVINAQKKWNASILCWPSEESGKICLVLWEV
ncbi:hypothetical protein Tco_0665482, partial [Tanacetum coccineum]